MGPLTDKVALVVGSVAPTITKRIPPALYALFLDSILHLKQMRLFQVPSFDTYEFLPFTSAAEIPEKRRRMRKEQAAVRFEKVLSTLQHRDALLYYTDGSSKFHRTKGYIGGLALLSTNSRVF